MPSNAFNTEQIISIKTTRNYAETVRELVFNTVTQR